MRERTEPGIRGGAAILRALLRGLSAPLLVLLLWALAARLFSTAVLPGPGPVLRRFLELLRPELLSHAGASLLRTALALALATLAALPLGVLLGRVRWAGELLTPTVYLLYPVPKIALLPLVFLLAGVGEAARILLVWLVLFFQVLVAVRDAAASVPPGYAASLTLLGGGRLDYLRFVLLPYILPSLLTSLRIGSGTALAVLFFAETFFTDRGLGFFIVDSWIKASYVDMSAGILAIGILGFLIFLLLDAAQRVVSRWK
jgi:NitT/TauT family transport system permease protein